MDGAMDAAVSNTLAWSFAVSDNALYPNNVEPPPQFAAPRANSNAIIRQDAGLRPTGGGMDAAAIIALAWSFCSAKTPMP
ncbi:MAG: hypothetical protein LBH35_09610 [Treponema sp.]|jgi:hypothetical protein|nr:hypothetical protein [Treponema sp.]